MLFRSPPRVQSAVIRLTRNSRTDLGCDEKLFRTVVKTAFGQRRKTLRNSLKPLLRNLAPPRPSPAADLPVAEPVEAPPTLTEPVTAPPSVAEPVEAPPTPSSDFLSDPVFDLRPERLSVEDFVSLTLKIQNQRT